MAKVIIPTPLRKFTDNQKDLEAKGDTVIAAIIDLANKYPDLQKHLFDDEGGIRSFVKIFVGDDDIRALNNENTSIEQDAVISIIPAIAGGANRKNRRTHT